MLLTGIHLPWPDWEEETFSSSVGDLTAPMSTLGKNTVDSVKNLPK